MASVQESFVIPYGEKEIPANLTVPEESNGSVVILTHGSGSDMHFPQLATIAEHLARAGFYCLRFTDRSINLAYKVKLYNAVLSFMFHHEKYKLKSCFLSGRSLGARSSVGLANQIGGTELGDFVKGVACLAYPLHPPKEKNNLRNEPLRDLQYPVIFVSGTHDHFCDPELMKNVLKTDMKDKAITMHWITGGDHSFKVKSKDQEDSIKELCELVIEWCLENSHDLGEQPAKKQRREPKLSDAAFHEIGDLGKVTPPRTLLS